MKQKIVTLGMLALSLTPVVSIVSCDVETPIVLFDRAKLIKTLDQYKKENITFMPNLDMSTLSSNTEYSPEQLGVFYISLYEDVEVKLKITDLSFVGQGFLKVRIFAKNTKGEPINDVFVDQFIFGYRPTDNRYEVLRDYTNQIYSYLPTKHIDVEVIDFFRTSSEPKTLTLEEVGITLPALPDDVIMSISNITEYEVYENGDIFMPNQIHIEIVLRLNGALVSKKVWVYGFLPFRSHVSDPEFIYDINVIFVRLEEESIRNPLSTSLNETFINNFKEWEYYTDLELGLSVPMPSNEYTLHFHVVDTNAYDGVVIVTPFVEYKKIVNGKPVSGVVQTQDFFFVINGFKKISTYE